MFVSLFTDDIRQMYWLITRKMNSKCTFQRNFNSKPFMDHRVSQESKGQGVNRVCRKDILAKKEERKLAGNKRGLQSGWLVCWYSIPI